MTKIWLSVCIALLVAMPFSADAQVSVKGYYRSNGTYVQPHVRSAPNNTTADNWSTKGNINPYTGEKGTTNPPPPRYLPMPQPYVPIMQAPPSLNTPSYIPGIPNPLAAEKVRALAEIMALVAPQAGARQGTEYQSCYTIYDCQ
jgi:hypothetical protein